MTHRERLISALEHREIDMVPIDFGSTRDSSIVVEGYEHMKEHFGIREENRITSSMMRVVDINEAILQAFDIDTRGIFPRGVPDVKTGERRYRDEWGVERIRPPGSYYYDQVTFPLSGTISTNDISKYPWPDPDDPIRRQGLKDRLRAIREETDCASVLNLQSGFVHTSQYLRGFEDWFIDIAGDKKLIGFLFDAILEISLAICRIFLEEVGGDVDVLMASDDLGLQDGLMISPEAYRELIKPRHEKYFRLMHDMSPAKVFFHTCGSVADIIEDLIEIGVDVLHPVQVSAAGMEPKTLKKLYGDRLSFWGAVDTQHILPHGSVAEVKEEVEKCIEELSRNGGYILGAVHNIQPDVPLENIRAMYSHAREYIPSFKR